MYSFIFMLLSENEKLIYLKNNLKMPINKNILLMFVLFKVFCDDFFFSLIFQMKKIVLKFFALNDKCTYFSAIRR